MYKTFNLRLKKHHKFGTIYSSPHSGSNYPKAFIKNSNLDLTELRCSEDAFVGQLFEVSAKYNSAFIEAVFSRCFIDLNRSHLELDPKLVTGEFKFDSTPRNFAGLGVIHRLSSRGNSISKTSITFNEAQERLRKFYFPYHNGLTRLITAAKCSTGHAILFDCHSMPSSFRSLEGSEHKTNNKDVILGDVNGVSCDSQLTEMAKDTFERHGFSVKLNQPFAGGFITKNYGKPERNIHALQIEINRVLYMNEDRIEPNRNFNSFKKTLAKIIRELSSLTISNKLLRVAAE